MESEKKGFAAWVRKHRKQLIKAGLSVAAVAALIAVAYIKRDSIAELWQNLKALLEKSNSSKLISSDEVIRQETTILTEINENVCSVTEQTTISAKRFPLPSRQLFLQNALTLRVLSRSISESFLADSIHLQVNIRNLNYMG